ncbi:hypothetical protein COW36_19660 [bacterium (Candidatus Blackallbacteria) CG17_big_fil_post_rev_8_21_14_2_50_48_46]|uniref:Uncharacterized protein n=1 Tax=bacterium (Candidatus Blackallbacteria) CG17_big_fil_post_rev_8_21_14_2_50_48_46 TaxID=2014261 RepID=A0A2M7G0T7_9BACT|nr:MAG: hypothetical protein COW64_15635 [bacterium (Candidatus Blackallbacteria) CG18_big_fil_WC_8_21_14_2_50_49_26]PIW14870.1 MAG: hypothetical protein COW36_19660 [bacterium (Candidatus Blackallbacteria) CG17_big_fil_post_rev_8_21_14_2_50_48_46]PIW44437.1 MAG: hypothetical protein COW20_24235 [bacterium (Candidatus Blackallbacteria) CG13_big_fil_rev_8_21_14_2_50_49_14]
MLSSPSSSPAPKSEQRPAVTEPVLKPDQLQIPAGRSSVFSLLSLWNEAPPATTTDKVWTRETLDRVRNGIFSPFRVSNIIFRYLLAKTRQCRLIGPL